MTTTAFYTQHELTAHEIQQDKIRNAAIARNRGTAAPKRFKFRDPGAPANNAQKGKIWALLTDLYKVDRDKYNEASKWINANIENFTMETASKTIDRLKLRIEEAGNNLAPTPVVTPAPAYVRTPRDPFTDVPDGYYAVITDDEDGHLAFYRVSTWKKSGDRKVQVQASDILHTIKGYRAMDAILAKVRDVTPPVAGKMYADHLGNCWRCGRTLTDAESRARGIGPVCADK